MANVKRMSAVMRAVLGRLAEGPATYDEIVRAGTVRFVEPSGSTIGGLVRRGLVREAEGEIGGGRRWEITDDGRAFLGGR